MTQAASRPDVLYVPVTFGVGMLTLAYPLLTIAHFLAPVNLLGKNAYIALPALFLCLASVALFALQRRDQLLLWSPFAKVFLLGWLAGIVFAVRDVLYRESINVLYFRYIVLLFMIAVIVANVVRSDRAREWCAVLVLLATILQAVTGVLHAYVFPTINLIEDAATGSLIISLNSERSREAGTLVNPSIFAAILLCGSFLLTFYTFRSRILRNFPVRLSIFALLAYGISLSGTRFALAMSVVLLLILLVRSAPEQKGQLAVTVMLIAIGVALMAYLSPPPVESKAVIRIGEDSGGRLDKLLLPITLLASDIRAPLFGTSMAAAANARSASGVGISDNSYLLIATNFGVPLLFAWLALTASFFLRWIRRSAAAVVMFLYLLANWALTNSILWDPWLFYFLLTFFCIVFSEEQRERVPPAAARNGLRSA